MNRRSRQIAKLGVGSVGLGALLAGGVGPISPAGGDEFNQDSAFSGPEPDGGDERYCFDANLAADPQNEIHDTYNVTSAWSDLNAVFEGCDHTAPRTDGHWWTVDLPGNARGDNACINYHASGTCDHSHNRLDIAEIAEDPFGGGYNHGLLKSACHEAGHSYGLAHYKVAGNMNPPEGQHDCLISGPTDGQQMWQVYSNHHKGHINTNYP